MKCNKKAQLKLGKKIELEHSHLFQKSKRKTMAEKIAKDHLKESPCYYKELVKFERRLKKK